MTPRSGPPGPSASAHGAALTGRAPLGAGLRGFFKKNFLLKKEERSDGPHRTFEKCPCHAPPLDGSEAKKEACFAQPPRAHVVPHDREDGEIGRTSGKYVTAKNIEKENKG